MSHTGGCHFEGGNPTLPGSFCGCPKCQRHRAGDMAFPTREPAAHEMVESVVEQAVLRVLKKLFGG